LALLPQNLIRTNKLNIMTKVSNEEQSNNANVLLCAVPDLTLLWEKVILMHKNNEMTTERKDEVLNALDYLDRRGLITLKFGI
jgi:hypothetical protein